VSEAAAEPQVEAEVVGLRAEVVALRVENAELRTDNKWLKRIVGLLVGVVCMLIVALFVAWRPRAAGGKMAANPQPKGSIRLLFGLMKELMAAEEVERFLQHHFGDEGTAIIQSLARATSENELFHNVLLALKRQGLLTELFFDALIEFRPRQREYILRIQARYLAVAGEEHSPSAANAPASGQPGAAPGSQPLIRPRPQGAITAG
jgi:hypothetical protein